MIGSVIDGLPQGGPPMTAWCLAVPSQLQFLGDEALFPQYSLEETPETNRMRKCLVEHFLCKHSPDFNLTRRWESPTFGVRALRSVKE
jgi:hypothetical protein